MKRVVYSSAISRVGYFDGACVCENSISVDAIAVARIGKGDRASICEIPKCHNPIGLTVFSRNTLYYDCSICFVGEILLVINSNIIRAGNDNHARIGHTPASTSTPYPVPLTWILILPALVRLPPTM